MSAIFQQENFYKREILGFAICGAKGYFENWGVLWSVYTYIQSMRKDRMRSVLCSFAQEDQVPRYMDHNAHGSVIYTYRICTYHVLRLSRKITFYQPHKLIYLVSIGFTFITCTFHNNGFLI